MGKITDIQKQKRNRTRVSIFIDGEFVCGLDEVAVAAARLKVGDEISPEEMKTVMREGELNSAFDRAVGYLSLSLRSRREIAEYLSGKGYARDVVDETLAKLESYRYVDDYVYAQSYIKSKSKKYGAFRLAAELKQKGVDRKIIDELLDGAGDDGISAVAEKYIRSHSGADKQKLKRFLAGRGFGWDSIDAEVSRLEEIGAFEKVGGDDWED